VKYLHWGLRGIVLGTIVAVMGRCALWMPWYVMRTLRNGVIVEHLETKAGYEFVIRITPSLMSDRHAVVSTRHEYLETWLLGNGGTMKFIRGEPTDPSLAGSVFID